MVCIDCELFLKSQLYLKGAEITEKCICSTCWNEHEYKYNETLFSQNITHNLNSMADEGGFYEAIWRPDQNGIMKADQLIPILEKAVTDMRSEPERFKQHNAPNGWGLYEDFLPWLEKYLQACKENPEAIVRVSR